MKNSIIKKGLGIVSVAVFAMALFFNTSIVNSSNGDLELADLIAMETADAEWSIFGCCPEGTFCNGSSYCHYSLFASGC